MLETQALTKSFGGLKAVDKVNFKVNDKEHVGIIGPNGAGKTTFINLISGYFRPTAGKVIYEGKDITRWSPEERVQAGIVRTFQLASIFTELKVIENVALAIGGLIYRNKLLRWGFLGHILSNDVRKIAINLLEEIGLEEKMYKKCSELSYGERRKVEIAMAIALNPKVILVDEPFAGLSEAEIPEVTEILKMYLEDKILIIVDHKISKIIPFVKRLCVMHEGKIICDGEPNKVICDPEVRKVYWKHENT